MAAVQKALSTAKDKKLGLVVNGQTLENGQHVPRKDTQSPPALSLPTSAGAVTYLAICLDLDAPFSSLSLLSPILHWLQPGIRAAPSPKGDAGTAQQLETSATAPVASWIPAGPPPLAAAHRYLLVVFKEPEGFDAKKFGQPAAGKQFPITKRMKYNLDKFLKDAKVGEPVAAGWFTSN